MTTTEIEWFNPFDRLPPLVEGCRGKCSEVVLVWVGENDYSHREVTTAYYDFRNHRWDYLEEKYSRFDVLKWTYLPCPPSIDEE